jgi:hypothetical protein
MHSITMRLSISLSAIIFFGTPLAAQQKVTLSGYVKDKQTGEGLIGVNVLIKETSTGAATNPYGFYSITLPVATYQVTVSYMGYQSQNFNLNLTTNHTRDIALEPDVAELQEVVVSAKSQETNESPNRPLVMDIAQLKKMPALVGEPDLIKMVQMMPGVVTAAEGSSSYFVRGGSADQNLILIDEAPIYDPSHLLGLVSVFNSDVIKESELYRGGIPASFGGRLSSVMDVRTKDGNNQHFAGTGGISPLAGRLSLEGPIAKDKASFILSGRRSFIDLILNAANSNTSVFFHDYNLKLNWKASASNRFFISAYSGRDQFKLNNFGFGWGNSTVTFRWNHLFSPKLFSNTTLIGSEFQYQLTSRSSNSSSFNWSSFVREFSLKQDFNYFVSPKSELSFGYQGTLHVYSPTDIRPIGNRNNITPIKLEQLYALDHGLYASVKHNFDKWKIGYGLRLSAWQQIGPSKVSEYVNSNGQDLRARTLAYEQGKVIKSYFNWEPRLSVRYELNSANSLHVSYQRMVQNSHLVNVGTVPLPFNTWYPSGYYLKPQLADQVTLGYNRNLKKNTWHTGIEVYYKDMNQVTDFADRAEVFFNENLPITFRQGRSWSYGVELMLEKKVGRLTGFMNYTWSKTDRQIAGVNNGNVFPSNFDRRHSFNATALFEVNKRWTLSAAFMYASGRPLTLPIGRYELDGQNVDWFGERNSTRLPDAHRLDLSATLHGKQKGRFKSYWVFSIYNVYGQKNPFAITTRVAQDANGNVIGDGTQKEARLTYFFNFLPSVAYNFKF